MLRLTNSTPPSIDDRFTKPSPQQRQTMRYMPDYLRSVQHLSDCDAAVTDASEPRSRAERTLWSRQRAAFFARLDDIFGPVDFAALRGG